jgi:hypothetical protein
MKRILSVMLVVALLLAVSASPAFAFANPENNGNAETAPGQEKATDACQANLNKQINDGNTSNGHKIPGNSAPLNCDHVYP